MLYQTETLYEHSALILRVNGQRIVGGGHTFRCVLHGKLHLCQQHPVVGIERLVSGKFLRYVTRHRQISLIGIQRLGRFIHQYIRNGTPVGNHMEIFSKQIKAAEITQHIYKAYNSLTGEFEVG